MYYNTRPKKRKSYAEFQDSDYEENKDDDDFKVHDDEDSLSSDDEFVMDEKKKKNQTPKKKKKKETIPTPKQEIKKKSQFDPDVINELEKKFPSGYWKTKLNGMIDYINSSFPLEFTGKSITHPGQIYAMALSNDGTMLATASTLGSIRIWDVTTWELIQELRDEGVCDKFYV